VTQSSADSPPKGQGDVVGVRETPLTEAGLYQTTRIRCCPDVPKIRVAGAIQHGRAIEGVRNLRLEIVNVAKCSSPTGFRHCRIVDGTNITTCFKANATAVKLAGMTSNVASTWEPCKVLGEMGCCGPGRESVMSVDAHRGDENGAML